MRKPPHPAGDCAPAPRIPEAARTLRRFAVGVLAAAALAGCAEAASDAPRFAQRDSAGIAIVENEQPAWAEGEALTLAPEPRLVIGSGGGPEYDLSRVAGAARLDDGRIVIGDGGSLQIRFYDSAGVFLHAAAGRGDGPGELQAMHRFDRLRGDTLVVVSANGSATRYDASGQFVGAFNVRAVPLDLPGIHMIALPLAGGSHLVGAAGIPSTRGPAERWIDSMPAAIVGPDGAIRHRFGRLPAFAMAMHEGAPTMLRFSPVAAFAASAESLFWGIGTAYSINQYATDGRLVRIIRRRWTPVPLSDADAEQLLRDRSARDATADRAEREREIRSALQAPHADTIPAFSELIIDRTGRLWVREANPADAVSVGQTTTYPVGPSRWSVFDPTGRWLGDVTMPARFWPREIGEEYVLGIARDELDVQTVVEYALRRGAAGR